jgi:release factor glutamine methyltransferase
MNTLFILYKEALNSKYSAHEISLMFRELASKHCDIPIQKLYFLEDIECTDQQKVLLQKDLERLSKGEPFQYVLGYTEFCGLKLNVDENVLIPRQETSELIEWIVRSEVKVGKILDVGTGSGCIALALKKHFPEAEVWAVDKSIGALKVASKNADDTALFVNFKEADMLTQLGELPHDFDVVVSNPPYIIPSEKVDMPEDVLNFEPHMALFAPQEDPLLYYRAVAEFAYKCSAAVYFEINPLFSTQTCDMLLDLGFSEIEIKKDISKKPRMIWAK